MRKILVFLLIMAAFAVMVVPAMAENPLQRKMEFGPVYYPSIYAVDMKNCFDDFSDAQEKYYRFYGKIEGQSLAFIEAYTEQIKQIGVDLRPDGGSIDNGSFAIYGRGPNVYRINYYANMPAYDIFKLSDHEFSVTVSAGGNKITFIVDEQGVRVIDADLPSMTARTSSTGVSAGHGVELSKNELIRGLNVLANFINTQSTSTIAKNCGPYRPFSGFASNIITGRNDMRAVLESAIKNNNVNPTCKDGKVILFMF